MWWIGDGLLPQLRKARTNRTCLNKWVLYGQPSKLLRMRQIFRLQNIGTSIGIALPPTLLRAMGLAEGQVVVVSQTADGALLIQPKQSRKKYTAAKLNALCNSNAPMPSDLTHWEQVKPVGSEAW